MDYPLITCICVTRNRDYTLRRAIRCFQNQTYPNKELLIVYEDDDPVAEKVVFEQTDKRIKSLKITTQPKRTLGEIRNTAIEESMGILFCQWDDDDWYHMRRIEVQFMHLAHMKKPVCILGHWLIFNELENQAYCGYLRFWEGSILCEKGVVNEHRNYTPKSVDEDSDFVGQLIHDNLIYPLIFPSLYIYVLHDTNVWGEAHRNYLCSRSQKLSASTSTLLRDILGEKINPEESANILDSVEILSEIRYIL